MNTKDLWEQIYERTNLPWTSSPIPLDILNTFSLYFSLKSKILDYGGGDGLLSKVLVEKGFDVICSDISEKALLLAKEKLPNITTIQSSDPADFIKNNYLFDGILVWGVFHHIDIEAWPHYLKSFHTILKDNGTMLLGGHSTKDSEFQNGSRISPTTGLVSHAINNIEGMLSGSFSIEETDYFEFEEGNTKSKRIFKYYLLRKT